MAALKMGTQEKMSVCLMPVSVFVLKTVKKLHGLFGPGVIVGHANIGD